MFFSRKNKRRKEINKIYKEIDKIREYIEESGVRECEECNRFRLPLKRKDSISHLCPPGGRSIFSFVEYVYLCKDCWNHKEKDKEWETVK